MNTDLGLRESFGDRIARRPACIEVLESRIAPATIYVTTLADHEITGKTTLSDALNQANAALTPDMIDFGSASHPLKGTITLTSALPSITNDVTITAPGITINGAGRFQGLSITDGAMVTINDIKIVRGFAATGAGLYINDSGATITINDAVITGNHAVGAKGSIANMNGFGYPGEGGGIANLGGSVTIQGSKITHNSAAGGAGATGYSGGTAAGGGIFNGDTLTITNSTISGNTATGGRAGPAGNYIPYSSRTMTGPVNATAGGFGGNAYGGGIANSGGTVTVQQSVISGNSARGAAGAPGGRASVGLNGYAMVVNAGGVFGPSDGTNGGNGYAGGGGGNAVGGGIGGNGSGTVTLTQSTVSGNTATSGRGANGSSGGKGGNGGAGGRYDGMLYPAGNGGNGGNAGYGGNGGLAAGAGVYCVGSLTINNSTVSGNTATAGKAGIAGKPGAAGSGYAGGGATAGAPAMSPTGTFLGSRGGGIDSEQGSLYLTQVTVAKNTAVYGGGVSVYEDSLAAIDNCTISLNTAHNTTGGGGLFITLDLGGDPVNVVSTIIAGNKNTNVDGTLGGNSSNNLTSGNPMLGALGFHDGGTTETMLPSIHSPAVLSDPGLNPEGLGTDQNGKSFNDADIYIGSVQTTS
jgi:hypothetical protein